LLNCIDCGKKISNEMKPRCNACAMKPQRDIPNTNQIEMYFHCGRCLSEKPAGVSPKEWAQTEVGFTKIGLQVWCKRHDCNICHIDFEGQQHPANLTAKG
jgi:hypothetical protein